MKSILALFSFVIFASITANASQAWLCKVSAFMDEYEDLADSKTVAKFNVQKKCKVKHDEMHCRDVKCTTEDEAPTKEESTVDASWVCKVSAFTDVYEAVGSSKTAAKANVQKKCELKHDEMHCDDVKCTTEDLAPGSTAKASKVWVCKVSAFMDNYESMEDSKTAAKYKVQKKCEAKHDEIHCRSVTCISEED